MKSCVVIFAVIGLLSACGGSRASHHANGVGGVALKVTSPTPFDPSIAPAVVEHYRIIISGEGIDPPIEMVVDGSADSATISDIPAGEDRLIVVEARNGNNVVVRQGEATVTILGGGVTAAELTIDIVPIITNLTDGNWIKRKNLVFRVLGDPAHPVQVTAENNSNSTDFLTDISTQQNEIYPDAETSLAVIAPAPLSVGEYHFRVADRVTERESTVRVRLYDGSGEIAPMWGGGKINPSAGGGISTGITEWIEGGEGEDEN